MLKNFSLRQTPFKNSSINTNLMTWQEQPEKCVPCGSHRSQEPFTKSTSSHSMQLLTLIKRANRSRKFPPNSKLKLSYQGRKKLGQKVSTLAKESIHHQKETLIRVNLKVTDHWSKLNSTESFKTAQQWSGNGITMAVAQQTKWS